MNALIPMYVYSQNFIIDRAEMVRDHYKNRDRGASLVEYAGLVVLAAVILGLIYWAVTQAQIGNKVRDAINNLLSGQGTKPQG